MVATLDRLIVRTMIDQSDAELASLSLDAAPEVRLAGRLGDVLVARRAREVPAAHHDVPPALTHHAGGPFAVSSSDPTKSIVPLKEIQLELGNPQLSIVPGQRAHVRFRLDHKLPLMWQWSVRFWQLIQRHAQDKTLG